MKKNNLLKIITILIISFVTAIFLETVVFNFQAVFKDSLNLSVERKDYKNFKVKNGSYITTKNSYININAKDKYLDKIIFNYKTNENISWKVNGFDSDNNVIYERVFSNVSALNKSIKKVGFSAAKFRIEFLNKNIKISNMKLDDSISFNWGRVFTIFMFMSSLIILFIYRQYFIEKKEKLFLFICLTISGTLILVLPKMLYCSWDDQEHLNNSYFLLDIYKTKSSEAITNMFSSRKFADEQYVSNYQEKKELDNYLNKAHKKKIMNYKYSTTFSYKTLIYLPFTIGFKIGDILNLPWTISLILAKLFNLFVYATLLYFAIKIIPFGKNVLLCILLLPSLLFLASQLSYDPTITAGIVLAVSVFIYEMKHHDKKLTLLNLTIFLAASIWASFPKPIYIPVILLLLILPSEKFNNKKQERLFKVGIVILFFVVVSSFVLPSLSATSAGDTRGGDTGVGRQLRFIIHNPIVCTKLFLKIAGLQFFDNFMSVNAFARFGYLKNMPNVSIMYYILLLILLYFVFKERNNIKDFNIKHKTFMTVIVIMIYFLIWLTMYLAFTPVGTTDIIKGVQTRYFIPLLFLFYFILIPLKKKDEKLKPEANKEILIIIFYIAIVMMSFYQIVL